LYLNAVFVGSDVLGYPPNSLHDFKHSLVMYSVIIPYRPPIPRKSFETSQLGMFEAARAKDYRHDSEAGVNSSECILEFNFNAIPGIEEVSTQKKQCDIRPIQGVSDTRIPRLTR
jgi:hypothetical protein